ncbi:MAG: insulinase family protein [Betaproteobacteria bacterium]|nr:insulinase family protein [Betaproteobacteria bacterium]
MGKLPSLLRYVFPVVAAFCSAAAVAALPPGIIQGPSIEGMTEYRLPNGLTVLLFPDPSKPTTTVNVTYRVGAVHENYGETGMAHLLEHLVFKGTPSRGNVLQELGRRGMSFNGTTSWDRTNYYESFTASTENLDWALAMEADRMVNSFIAKKDLDSEMTVVRNEMESGENNPSLMLLSKMLATAYQWHNYGKMPIGARSDVENVNIERLQAFYRLYYQPDNAVLTVAGKFDPDATLALIAKYFGPIPKPMRSLPDLYTAEPVQDGERNVTLRRVGSNKLLGLMYHTVPGASPEYVSVDTLGEIMTLAPSGRMYKALVETKIAASVDSWHWGMRDPGHLSFLAQIPETQDIEPARTAMLATIDNLSKEPITEAEVARVRAKAAKAFDDVINDPQKLGVAISESIALGDWRLFFLQRDQYRKVTAEDVQRVARDFFKRSNVTVGEFVPDAKPDRASAPPTVDVAAMLKDYKGDASAAAGEVFDTSTANLDARTQRFMLQNGMKVALLPKKTRGEAVTFALTTHYGDERSVFGKQADGTLTAALLKRGTAKKNRQEVEDTLDTLRAKVSVGGSEVGATVAGQTFRAQLPETLRLVAEILRQPAFPPTELDNLKRERVSMLESARTEPQAVAQRALRRHNNPYPAGDPRYVPTLDEALATVNAVTPESVRKFYSQFYGASNAEIALVGDFDAAAIRALITELFGGWKSPSAYARVPNPLVPNQPAALKFELPDKANAMLIGRLALPINDMSADYPALSVANFILGDSTDSRLLNRLRQKEGLSYSTGSFFTPSQFEPNSSLGVYAIFAPENLDKVRSGLSEEIARALQEGFTDQEVADAKAGLLQERRLARAQDGAVAGSLANQLYLDRTFATSGEIDAKIEKLTTAEVNAALRKYLKAPEFAFSFAGDFAKIKR